MTIIDGKKIAENIKDGLASDVFGLLNRGYRHPHLSIISADNREDSKLYVSLKEKAAKEVGIDVSLYKINEGDSEQDIIDVINFLNTDDKVDGILVQLPLPSKFNTKNILPLINPEKDVDGFNSEKIFYSPVMLAIKYSLDEKQVDYNNKKAFLFFNSDVFKKEVKNFLNKLNIEVEAISSEEFNKIIKDKNKLNDLQEQVKKYDILITAIGQPEIIDSNFLNNDMIVIDIGITKIDKKVWGDVKMGDTKKLSGYITPVPGGIGPMTVACLLKNVLQAYLLKYDKE
jgi:methylenetetrahydrofolate dehydrogenase (NADP+)/methenyltetrahydrofolate cyclohydrolase